MLAAGAGDAAEEADEATDDIGNRRGAARRTTGQLSSMSGAGGLSYMEYDTGGAAGRGGRGGRGRGAVGAARDGLAATAQFSRRLSETKEVKMLLLVSISAPEYTYRLGYEYSQYL